MRQSLIFIFSIVLCMSCDDINVRQLQPKEPRRQQTTGNSWQLKHEDTMGALTLHSLFESRLDQANDVASSWSGDRIQLWENESNGVALVGLVEFDSNEAAKILESEFIRLCREKWMQGGAIRELEHDGTHLEADGDHFVLERRKSTVVFVRCTGGKNPASVVSSLWRSKVNHEVSE